MASRRWDDPWQRYPESVPLRAEGGLATSKQRGAMASTWWSRRFVDVLESYGLGARMRRGRRYARQGQVLSIEVRPAVLVAQVQGSRRTPYLVTVSLSEPSAAQWQSITSAMAGQIGFVARLLTGEVPPDLETVFEAADVALFPSTWGSLRAECSCPDWENPCKHIAAVLYLFADQLDADPWLLLQWRGRTRGELLEPLRGTGTADGLSTDDVAPWWPFTPGSLPALPDPSVGAAVASEMRDPSRPDAVLDQLEDLEIDVRGTSLRDVLRGAYERIGDALDEPTAI
jgi:uncharacterized Zn finger protein